MVHLNWYILLKYLWVSLVHTLYIHSFILLFIATILSHLEVLPRLTICIQRSCVFSVSYWRLRHAYLYYIHKIALWAPWLWLGLPQVYIWHHRYSFDVAIVKSLGQTEFEQREEKQEYFGTVVFICRWGGFPSWCGFSRVVHGQNSFGIWMFLIRRVILSFIIQGGQFFRTHTLSNSSSES